MGWFYFMESVMLLTVVFSNHCNLDCSYCCIGNKNTSPILTATKAIEFLLDNIKDGEENIVEFYGGEPLLHYEQIKSTIKELRHAKPNVNITTRMYTNGLFFYHDDTYVHNYREITDYIDEILISLDGPSWEHNKARFSNLHQMGIILSVISGLTNYIDQKNLGNKVIVSTVLSSDRQYSNLLENTVEFASQSNVKHFSIEPLTIFGDSTPVVISKQHFKEFVEGIFNILWYLCIKKSVTEKDYSLFVAKELISTSWYNVGCGNSCSDIARAISPRGKIYMCRDYAANEEKLFHSEKVIQFKNVNNLSIDYDNFKSIKELENRHTPCIVKDLQYEASGVVDQLYWLRDDYQEFIIKPMHDAIVSFNNLTNENCLDFRDKLQDYRNKLPDIFKMLGLDE